MLQPICVDLHQPLIDSQAFHSSTGDSHVWEGEAPAEPRIANRCQTPPHGRREPRPSRGSLLPRWEQREADFFEPTFPPGQSPLPTSRSFP